VQVAAKGDFGNGALARERALLGEALEAFQGLTGAMVGFLGSAPDDPRNIYKVGLNTTRFLMSLGDLVIGWLLLRQAEVAIAALDAGVSDRDKTFYEGKVASARFFCSQVLPELATRRAITEATDLSLMDLDEAAF
jgi:hypothetical protein